MNSNFKKHQRQHSYHQFYEKTSQKGVKTKIYHQYPLKTYNHGLKSAISKFSKETIIT